MNNPDTHIAGRSLEEWAALSDELDQEQAGAPQNTQPMTAEEARWYRRAALEKGPKVKVTIRLRQWQIDRAKEIARQRGDRGYQTVLDEVITEGLLGRS